MQIVFHMSVGEILHIQAQLKKHSLSWNFQAVIVQGLFVEPAAI